MKDHENDGDQPNEVNETTPVFVYTEDARAPGQNVMTDAPVTETSPEAAGGSADEINYVKDEPVEESKATGTSAEIVSNMRVFFPEQNATCNPSEIAVGCLAKIGDDDAPDGNYNFGGVGFTVLNGVVNQML